MTTKRQAYAFVLTLILVLSMIPTYAFADSTHNIFVESDSDGVITLGKTTASTDEVVTFSAMPNQGALLDIIQVNYEDNGEFNIIEPDLYQTDPDGKEYYQFTMPAFVDDGAFVTVVAEFLSEREVNVYRVVYDSVVPHGKVTVKNLVATEGETEKMLVTFGGKVHAED